MKIGDNTNEFQTNFWNKFEGEKTLQNIIQHFVTIQSPNDSGYKKDFIIKIMKDLIGKEVEERKLFELLDFEISKMDLSKIKVKATPRQTQSIDQISIFDADKLDGNSFQDFIAKLLETNGYSEVKITGKSGDQGGDLLATSNNEQLVIQTKRYSIDKKVTNSAVQEVLGAIGWYNADKGIVVTNSMFTTSAKELAKINKIELWDRKKVSELIENHNSKVQ